MNYAANETLIPEIEWSVWSRSKTVIWHYNGDEVRLEFQLPPLSVSILRESGLVGVALNYEEASSDNLHIYDFKGNFIKRLHAPELGEKAQIGFIREIGSARYEVSIGYFKDEKWEDVAGEFSIESEELIGKTHRNY